MVSNLLSTVVILNEDRTKIKRKHPVPENLNTDQRTAHVVCTFPFFVIETKGGITHPNPRPAWFGP